MQVDVTARQVRVYVPGADAPQTFPFALSRMEERFLRAGGVERLYKVFKQGLFKALVAGPKGAAAAVATPISRGDVGCGGGSGGALAW